MKIIKKKLPILLITVFALGYTMACAQSINSITPNTAEQNDVLTVDIEGADTQFLTATGLNIWLEKGNDIITPTSFVAQSETQVYADLSLDANETTGLYDVVIEYYVNSELQSLSLADGFEVILWTNVSYMDNNIQIEAYPNPVDDILNVKLSLNDANNVLISVVDINGKVVRNETFHATSSFHKKLNFSSLQPGVYNMILKVGHKIYTKKIIKL